MKTKPTKAVQKESVEFDNHEKYLTGRKAGGQRRRNNMKRDKDRNNAKFY